MFIAQIDNYNAKNKLENILSNNNALNEVKKLTPLEALILVNETGLEQSSELLSLLSTSQVQSIFDIEAWKSYSLNPQKLGQWLIALQDANSKMAYKHFLELDIELISYIYKLHTKVFDLSLQEDPGEIDSLHIITPDNKYLIVFCGNSQTEDLVRFLKLNLEQLFSRNMAFALKLLEAIRWETLSSLEEEALKWRDARLLDLGFAPSDEQKIIFARLELKNLKKRKPIAEKSDFYKEDINQLSNIKAFGTGIFYKLISELSVSEKELVLNELIALVNNVHLVQEDVDFTTKSLSETFKYVVIHLEISLMAILKANMLSKINEYYLRDLFRLGYTLVNKAN
jgi:hypothetical protein